jgi:hypothetical protein
LRNSQVHSLRRPLAPLAALTLLLGGCAVFQKQPQAVAPPPPPEAAPCVQLPQIPSEPPMVGNKFNGDAKHDLQVLAPNAIALRDWGQHLRKMLEACAPRPTEHHAEAKQPS